MYVERAAEGANEADGPFSAASPVVPSARMGDNVTLARDGAIATVTLNRPERRNSLSDAMLTELAAAFVELRDDAGTRVVIVTGAREGDHHGVPALLRRRGADMGPRAPRRARRVALQGRARLRRRADPKAVQGDGGGQGPHQRRRAHRHSGGQRDDGGIPRSWLTAR